MGTLNEILSLMYRMDKGYSKAVNLNEGSLAHTLLVEDKRTNQARQRSRDVIRQVLSDEQLTDEQVETELIKFEDKFYHDPKMRSSAVMRLEPLFCRLAFWYGFSSDSENLKVINGLNEILNFLFKKQNEIDLVSLIPNEALYTITYDDLVDMFEEQMDAASEAEEQEMAKNNYTPNDYDIIGPLDYAEAQKIGNLSYPGGRLCYTQNKYTWGDYTNDGTNNAYVALRKGWDDEEKFPPVHDKNFVSPYDPTQTPTDESPYDTYGLSMIFIFVSPEGELTTCNTRWNHKAYYPGKASTDHALERQQVSEILGVDFIKRFCGNGDVKFKQAVKNAVQLLKNGDLSGFDQVTTFNSSNRKCVAVRCGKKWNVIVDNKIKYKQWFDLIWSTIYLDYGYMVKIGRKQNIIDENGDLIFNVPYFKWFDYIRFLNKEYWIVGLKRKENIYSINEKRYILPLWVEIIDNSKYADIEYFITLYDDEKYNFFCLDKNSPLILPFEEWFDSIDYIYPYKFQIYVIEKNGKENILHYKKGFLSDKWFDAIDFSLDTLEEYGHLFGVIGGKCVKIYADENRFDFEISPHFHVNRKWRSNRFRNWFRVRVGDKVNYVDANNNIIFKIWFDRIDEDEFPLTVVHINQHYNKEKVNLLTPQGKFFFDAPYEDWLDGVYKFSNVKDVILLVKGKLHGVHSKYNIIAPNGKLIADRWFDKFEYIEKLDAYELEVNNKKNYFTSKGLAWNAPTAECFDEMVGPITNGGYYFEDGEYWCKNNGDARTTVVKGDKILGKIS